MKTKIVKQSIVATREGADDPFEMIYHPDPVPRTNKMKRQDMLEEVSKRDVERAFEMMFETMAAESVFEMMFDELDRFRRLGLPLVEDLHAAHSRLLKAKEDYCAGIIPSALGQVWNAGTGLYKAAYASAALIQKHKGARKTGALQDVERVYNDLRGTEDFQRLDHDTQDDRVRALLYPPAHRGEKIKTATLHRYMQNIRRHHKRSKLK